MADRQQPTPGEIVIMAGSAVMLIASFLPFYKVSGLSWNAWSNSFSILPLLTLMVVIGVAIGVALVLRRFANVKLPERVWLFSWTQLETALAVLIAVTTLCYVIRDTGGIDKGVGAWLLTLGAIALPVGVFIDRAQAGRSTL